MIPHLPAPQTHAFTAALMQAVPLWLTAVGIVVLSVALRGPLLAFMAQLVDRHTAHGRVRAVDEALLWTPPIVSPTRLLISTVAALLLLLVVTHRVVPLFVTLLLAGPVLVLLVWALLLVRERQYVHALDRSLPSAISRLAAQLRGGAGFQPALARVLQDLPPGPLASEWTFLATQIFVPLCGGNRATPDMVVAALATQTPSVRHRMVLGHLEVALGQTHDVQLTRLTELADALFAAERSRSQAMTELSQIRQSGALITAVTLALSAYLLVTQPERVRAAYVGLSGMVVAVVVLAFSFGPLIAGMLLARVDDQEL